MIKWLVVAYLASWYVAWALCKAAKRGESNYDGNQQ